MRTQAPTPKLTGTAYVLILVAVTGLVYANTLMNGFTVDDPFTYSQNNFIKDLRNLPHLFTTQYFQYSNEASYRPVCTLTYFADWALWRTWSGGPHLTNIFLYVCTVLVLFGFYSRLTRSAQAAFLGAALFALHPVHSEVVNNISFREDLLVCLFLPTSWLCYRRSRQGKSWLWMIGAWTLYMAGAFSKELAIIFPVLVVLIEWHDMSPGEPVRERSRLWYLGGLAFLTLLFIVIRFSWMNFPLEGQVARLGGSIAGTLIADITIQARYLLLFFFPIKLRALYPESFYALQIDLSLLISTAIFVLLGILGWRHRRQKTVIVGWAWWFISMAPVANIYPLYNPMAERYLLWPSIGLCLWAGWGLDTLLKTRLRVPVVALSSFAALVMATTVVMRNPVWRNDVTLWSDTAESAPDNPMALANLAAAYYQQGEFNETITHAEKALELHEGGAGPLEPAPSYLALGSAYFMKKELDRAIRNFHKAEQLLPVRFDIDAAVFRNLGLAYDAKNDIQRALTYYLEAKELDPFSDDLWRKIAFCRLRLGDSSQAARDWQRAMEINATLPSFAEIERAYQMSVSGKQ
jgi:Tfp pilus assembly protein PilF